MRPAEHVCLSFFPVVYVARGGGIRHTLSVYFECNSWILVYFGFVACDFQEMEEMFNRMDTGIKNIAAMETMVENKMNVTTGSMLPGGQANFLQLMKVRHA